MTDPDPQTVAVTLNFQDGVQRIVECRSEETVVQAALHHGIRLLTDCLEGACATCKARCLSGEFELDDPSFDALSETEENNRIVLLCQMRVSSECTIELPYALSFIDRSPSVELVTRLSELVFPSPNTARIALTASAPVAFVPGQYGHLHIPGTHEKRHFSFASRAGERSVEFWIRLLDAGVATDYLRDRAEIGDSLRLESAFGHFYLRPCVGSAVFVAGGTGIAPFLAMLDHLVHNPTSRPTSIQLLYGAAHPSELVARERLQAIAQALPQLSIQYFADELAECSEVNRGSPCDALDATSLNESPDVYLCGPPGMVANAQTLLLAHGIPEARVFSERFIPSAE